MFDSTSPRGASTMTNSSSLQFNSVKATDCIMASDKDYVPGSKIDEEFACVLVV